MKCKYGGFEKLLTWKHQVTWDEINISYHAKREDNEDELSEKLCSGMSSLASLVQQEGC